MKILTQLHALQEVERSVPRKFGAGMSRLKLLLRFCDLYSDTISKYALRSPLWKLIQRHTCRGLVAMGDTGSGARAAAVICRAHVNNFFDARLRGKTVIPRSNDGRLL